MQRQMNLMALASGIFTLILIAASMFVPWWQLNVGEPALASVNFSPVNFNFALFSDLLTVPIIWALNIACFLTLLAGGVSLLLYSIFPTKSYAKSLLNFGYKKPLYAIVLFVVQLVILYVSVTMLTGVDLPFSGAKILDLPLIFTDGISVKVAVSAVFNWPFYLSIVVAGLCIAARVYHKKASTKSVANLPITNTI
jgi:hypothetical protein